MTLRIGQGYDIHTTNAKRPLYLGGVKIPEGPGLNGHSDADVLLHAIMDSLLGAVGLGDIGIQFPNNDENLKNIRSTHLLEQTSALLSQKNATILNIDATLVAEAPKISPFINEMKSVIGDILGIFPDQLGIKATTNEGVGDIGRGAAMCAWSVALVQIEALKQNA